jgi:hypothetical protein
VPNANLQFIVTKRNNADIVNAMIDGRVPGAGLFPFWYTQTIRYTDFGAPAALTSTVTLNTSFPQNEFPANVVRGTTLLERITPFSGGTVATATISIGGVGVGGTTTAGLLTATDVFTGSAAGKVETVAATLFGWRYEPTLSPTVLLTTTVGDIDEVVAGECRIHILCLPAVTV